jgi:uroporphyrinogen decarboxylase
VVNKKLIKEKIMTKREVVKLALDGQRPPYVPWSFGFTFEAAAKLREYYKVDNLEPVLENHILGLGSGVGFFNDIGKERVKDIFGVIWDRSEDKDIGMVEGQVLSEPTLKGYEFPNPLDKNIFAGIKEKLDSDADGLRIFSIGFSLYERAWTLRGMETLMMDFYDNPGFVKDLLRSISDYNIAQVNEALKYDIDGIHFGDDWGQQHGLIMGPDLWHEFIYPELKRMYGIVKAAGKKVSIHSCGDVDELFDDLIDIGLDCFNPFQPEVMNVESLMKQYRGKLAFHGGLSTQHTLPYGSVDDVVKETSNLLSLGADGGYIFAPAHAVEGDVPVENMLAFIDTVKNQPGVDF